MSRLESVENEVKQHTAEELRTFRDWFAEFDANAWDRQFESEVRTALARVLYTIYTCSRDRLEGCLSYDNSGQVRKRRFQAS